ncbi:MAG: YicC/YloC family endoribonuclease [Bacteroidota bacterium]
MILSMTGFGRAKGDHHGKSFTIEIKTLNGKQSDLRLKVPPYLRTKEITLRKQILDGAIRGKMDCTITIDATDGDTDYTLNTKLLERYFLQLREFGDLHDLQHQDFLQTIIRIPNIVQPTDQDITDAEWQYLQRLVKEALEQLQGFRAAEGQTMHKDLTQRVKTIDEALTTVEAHEAERNQLMKDRLHRIVGEHLSPENVDENRLEQEIIYYLEKLDIHEEKVRLRQHCDYFMEVVESNDRAHGKKLNFIAQEMGREINTLGSKAQYSVIQQIVVDMKVELDQIKEQLANVL